MGDDSPAPASEREGPTVVAVGPRRDRIVAAAIEKDSDDGISSETAENIGTNASDAVGSIMKDYIDIPTTISVDQGAVVMVMVNADLEML